jgi:four helix bundle protein
MKNFKDLIVWQKAIDLVALIYERTGSFPNEEKFGLTNQMRRAAVSIPSNIAEGHTRHTAADFKHFLRMALGSAAELETQVVIAEKLKYCSARNAKEILEKIQEIAKMTAVLSTKLRAS